MAVRSKKFAALLLAVAMPLALFGCGAKEDDAADGVQDSTHPNTVTFSIDSTPNTLPEINTQEDSSMPENSQNPRVTIELADGGKIVAELYPDKAPNTVNNFISLANSGYFDGKVFHRAVPGFMIQGGSPDGSSSSAGFPYAIKGEFASNGFTQNDLAHTAGVLSMARVGGQPWEDQTPYYNSASCQFFIMHGTAATLDGDYAAFGKVISGLKLADKIATSPTSSQMLITPVTIKKVTVETFGKTYAEPETLPPLN